MSELPKGVWINFEKMSRDEKIAFNAVDSKYVMIKYDDDQILRYDEESPFAIALEILILPS